MKINCYFCDYDNFGDQLNRVIIKNEIGYDVMWSPYDRASIIGIGSIIEAIVSKRNDKRKKSNEMIYCFSSGFACEEQISDLKKLGVEISLLRPVNFFAIRGEKTKRLLLEHNLMNKNCNPVLGDGGLLASNLIKKDIEKKYSVGIVAHAQEKDKAIFSTLLSKIPNSKLINIQQSPLMFLEELCECETIISTAMHPLIASDSLRIPNMWIRLSEEVSATKRFKFDDYYSALGLTCNPMDINAINENIKEVIVNNYSVSDDIIYRKKEELQNAIRIMKNKLDEHRKFLYKKYVLNIIYMCLIFYPNKFFVYYPKRIIQKIKNRKI